MPEIAKLPRTDSGGNDPADYPDNHDLEAEIRRDVARIMEAKQEVIMPVFSNPATTLDDYSEDSLAQLWVNRFGEYFRWTPGRNWMFFNGSYWEEDLQLKRYTMAGNMCRDVAINLEDKKKESIKTSRMHHSITEIAKSNSLINVRPEVWNADIYHLNTPDLGVCLKSGTTRPTQASDHCTQMTSVSPVFEPAPRFLKFLNEVFHDQEVIDFIQRFLGYCLTGDVSEQVLLFALGVGSNGKSTLLDLVVMIMGSYAKKLPINVLTQTKFDKHPTELAHLAGARLAISSEPEKGHQWAEARIKELTGDKTLSARFMRGNFFEFNLTHKHCIAGNYQPRLNGNDPAMARRMLLVPFNAVFSGNQKDPDLPKKLEAESGAILAWMIEGAVKWYTKGLNPPESILKASREYMESQDDIAAWIDGCCITGPNCKQGSADLYRNFTDWKKARNEPVWSQTEWGKEMATKGFTKKKTMGKQQYTGIESVKF